MVWSITCILGMWYFGLCMEVSSIARKAEPLSVTTLALTVTSAKPFPHGSIAALLQTHLGSTFRVHNERKHMFNSIGSLNG